jgi:hypothetical protein
MLPTANSTPQQLAQALGRWSLSSQEAIGDRAENLLTVSVRGSAVHNQVPGKVAIPWDRPHPICLCT